MTFSRLMIEKTFPYSDKIHDYSSISNELFDVTTVSLVPMLSFFSLLDIDRFCFGNRPCRLWFMSKKSFWNKTETSVNVNTSLKVEVHSTSGTVEALKQHSQESEYFKWSTITWDSNDTIKGYYPIRLCSSIGLLHPSQITSSTSIAQTITRRDSKSFVQFFAFWK